MRTIKIEGASQATGRYTRFAVAPMEDAMARAVEGSMLNVVRPCSSDRSAPSLLMNLKQRNSLGATFARDAMALDAFFSKPGSSGSGPMWSPQVRAAGIVKAFDVGMESRERRAMHGRYSKAG